MPRTTSFILSAVLLSLAMGCSSGKPSEYQRGTYRPAPAAPRAPTFTPTEDAPNTFQPGQPSPVQPGPRPARVLPETPETRKGPGLWSTNPPTASGENHQPKFLDVPLPHPPGTHLSDAQREPTNLCADYLLSGAKAIPGFIQYVRTLPRERQRCIVAKAFHGCIELLGEWAVQKRATSTDEVALESALVILVNALGTRDMVSELFVRRACNEAGVILTPNEESVWRRIAEEAGSVISRRPPR
jgi:hypothetical protein